MIITPFSVFIFYHRMPFSATHPGYLQSLCYVFHISFPAGKTVSPLKSQASSQRQFLKKILIFSQTAGKLQFNNRSGKRITCPVRSPASLLSGQILSFRYCPITELSRRKSAGFRKKRNSATNLTRLCYNIGRSIISTSIICLTPEPESTLTMLCCRLSEQTADREIIIL